MYSIGHVGVRVADMERALRFYINGLGGEKGNEYHMPSGSHLVFVNFADFSVELICKPDDDRAPDATIWRFLCRPSATP